MYKTTDELMKDNFKEFFKNSIQLEDIISTLLDELCMIEQFIDYFDDLYDKKEIQLKYYKNLREEIFKDE